MSLVVRKRDGPHFGGIGQKAGGIFYSWCIPEKPVVFAIDEAFRQVELAEWGRGLSEP